MTSHPADLSDELIAAIADLPTVCEHVHLPAQSGSDRVLAAMGRGYTAAWYLGRVAALRAAVADVALTTDLIVGFPGRDRRRLRATRCALVEAAGFDAAFTFVYSPRPGTAAAALPDQVPAEVTRERIERLIAATQAQSRRAARRGRRHAASRSWSRGRAGDGAPAARPHAPERHRELQRARPPPGALVSGHVTGSTSTHAARPHGRSR